MADYRLILKGFTRILAQHLDTPSAIKNCLITNKVTSKLFITPGKSICYTKRSRLTDVSRIMKAHRLLKMISVGIFPVFFEL